MKNKVKSLLGSTPVLMWPFVTAAMVFAWSTGLNSEILAQETEVETFRRPTTPYGQTTPKGLGNLFRQESQPQPTNPSIRQFSNPSASKPVKPGNVQLTPSTPRLDLPKSLSQPVNPPTASGAVELEAEPRAPPTPEVITQPTVKTPPVSDPEIIKSPAVLSSPPSIPDNTPSSTGESPSLLSPKTVKPKEEILPSSQTIETATPPTDTHPAPAAPVSTITQQTEVTPPTSDVPGEPATTVKEETPPSEVPASPVEEPAVKKTPRVESNDVPATTVSEPRVEETDAASLEAERQRQEAERQRLEAEAAARHEAAKSARQESLQRAQQGLGLESVPLSETTESRPRQTLDLESIREQIERLGAAIKQHTQSSSTPRTSTLLKDPCGGKYRTVCQEVTTTLVEIMKRDYNTPPDKVLEQVQHFNQSLAQVNFLTDEIGRLKTVRGNLTSSKPGERSLAEQAGLSPSVIKQRLAAVEMQITKLATVQSQALTILGHLGFQGTITKDAEYHILGVTTPFATAFSNAVKKTMTASTKTATRPDTLQTQQDLVVAWQAPLHFKQLATAEVVSRIAKRPSLGTGSPSGSVSANTGRAEEETVLIAEPSSTRSDGGLVYTESTNYTTLLEGLNKNISLYEENAKIFKEAEEYTNRLLAPSSGLSTVNETAVATFGYGKLLAQVDQIMGVLGSVVMLDEDEVEDKDENGEPPVITGPGEVKVALVKEDNWINETPSAEDKPEGPKPKKDSPPDVDDKPVDANSDKLRLRGGEEASVVVTSNDQTGDEPHQTQKLRGGGRHASFSNDTATFKAPKWMIGSRNLVYKLWDADGDEDQTVVEIIVKKAKKKKKGPKGRDDDKGWGGGGGPGGPGPCLDCDAQFAKAEQEGVDPEAIQAREDAEDMQEGVLFAASKDLMPNNVWDKRIENAADKFGEVYGLGQDNMLARDAAVQLQEAIGQRKNVIETLAEPASDTVKRLIESSGYALEALPVHPLLTKSDLPMAQRAWNAMEVPEFRELLKQVAPKLDPKAVTLDTEVTGVVQDLYSVLTEKEAFTRTADDTIKINPEYLLSKKTHIDIADVKKGYTLEGGFDRQRMLRAKNQVALNLPDSTLRIARQNLYALPSLRTVKEGVKTADILDTKLSEGLRKEASTESRLSRYTVQKDATIPEAFKGSGQRSRIEQGIGQAGIAESRRTILKGEALVGDTDLQAKPEMQTRYQLDPSRKLASTGQITLDPKFKRLGNRYEPFAAKRYDGPLPLGYAIQPQFPLGASAFVTRQPIHLVLPSKEPALAEAPIKQDRPISISVGDNRLSARSEIELQPSVFDDRRQIDERLQWAIDSAKIQRSWIKENEAHLRSFLTEQVLSPKEMQTAVETIRRLNVVRPEFESIKKVAEGLSLSGKADPIKIESAAAQTFLAQFMGKERLAVMQQVSEVGPNKVIGTSLRTGQPMREIALDRTLDMIEVQPIQRFQKDQLQFHHQRIQLAKDMSTKAVVANLRARVGEPLTKIDAQERLAANDLFSMTQLNGSGQLIKAAIELPIMMRGLNTLQVRQVSADVQKISYNAEDLFEKPTQTLKTAVDTRLNLLSKTAKADPLTYRSLQNYLDVSKQRLGQELALAKDVGAQQALSKRMNLEKTDLNKLLLKEIEHTQPFGPSKMPMPMMDFPNKGPGPTKDDFMTREAMDMAESQEDTEETISLPEAFPGSIGVVHRAEDLQDEAYVKELIENQPGGLVALHSQAELNNPDILEQILKDRLDGYGAVHKFADAEEMRDYVQSKIGGLGIAHTREQLNDPEYLRRQFDARVGGFGHFHEFGSAEEMREFAQSRLGQFGMAHLRSDLNDPEYMLQLYKDRFGGMGWAHEFESEEELADFIKSRVAGLPGNVFTCQDLVDQGMDMDRLRAWIDYNCARARRDFESEKDYSQRMLDEHPSEYVREEDGTIRRKTGQEMQAEREEALLKSGEFYRDPVTGELKRKDYKTIQAMREQALIDSGEFIRDPRTGNLIRAGTKAADQIKRRVTRGEPQTVRFRATDAFGNPISIEVEVGDFQSLRDAIEDQFARQGLYRSANGDWIDDKGNVVLSAARLSELDAKYTQAMNERNPGYGQFITHRSDAERPGIRQPTLEDQVAGLQETIRDAFGYTIDNLKIGGLNIGRLEVRPGESIPEALARVLEGSNYGFNEDGDIYDKRTGNVVVLNLDIYDLEDKYQKKVTESIFGKGYQGLSDEVNYLAQSGSAAQRAKAQQIINQLKIKAESLQQTSEQQLSLQDEIAKVQADPTLSSREKRKRLTQLNSQLSQVTQNRKDIEQNIIDNAQAANKSAAKVVQNQLSYAEQDLLRANRRAQDLAGQIDDIEDQLLTMDLTPYQHRELVKKRDRLLAELFKASREQTSFEQELDPKKRERIGSLVKEVDLGNYFEDPYEEKTFVADLREAQSKVAKVEIVERDGKQVAIYLDINGRVLVDPTGKEIIVPAYEGERVQEKILDNLAKDLIGIGRKRSDYNAVLNELSKRFLGIGDKGMDDPALQKLLAKLDPDTRAQVRKLAALSAKGIDDPAVLELLKKLGPDTMAKIQELAVQRLQQQGFQRKQEELGQVSAELSDVGRRIREIETLLSGPNAPLLQGTEKARLAALYKRYRELSGEANKLGLEINTFSKTLELQGEEATKEVMKRATEILGARINEAEGWRTGEFSITYYDENGKEQPWKQDGKVDFGSATYVDSEGKVHTYKTQKQRDYEKVVSQVEEARIRDKKELEEKIRQALKQEEERKRQALEKKRQEEADRLAKAQEERKTRAQGNYRSAQNNLTNEEKRLKNLSSDDPNRQELEQQVEQARMDARIAGAQAALTDSGLHTGINSQIARLQTVSTAYQAKVAREKEIRDRLATLEKEGKNPLNDPEARRLKSELGQILVDKKKAEAEVKLEKERFDGLIDHAQYVSAAPAYNASRLSELQNLIDTSGKKPEEALNSEQLKEYQRRKELQIYHDQYAKVLEKVNELKAIAARRDTGDPTYKEDYAAQARLSMGLTDREMRILMGENQRQEMLKTLMASEDPRAADQLAVIEKWMSDPFGALGGNKPLHNQASRSFIQGLGFLSNTQAAYKNLEEANTRLAERKKALAAAEAALKKENNAANRSEVYYQRQRVTNAESMYIDAKTSFNEAYREDPIIGYAQATRGRRLLEGDSFEDIKRFMGQLESGEILEAKASDGALKSMTREEAARQAQLDALYGPQTSGSSDFYVYMNLLGQESEKKAGEFGQSTFSGYLEEKSAEAERERQSAVSAELARVESFKKKNTEYLQGVAALQETAAQIQDRITHYQGLRTTYSKKLSDLAAEKKRIERGLEAGNLTDTDRWEKRLEEIRTQTSTYNRYLKNATFHLNNNQAQYQRQVTDVINTLPKAWERDPLIYAAERASRTQNMVELTREMTANETAQSILREDTQTRISDLQARLDKAEKAQNEKEIERLNGQIASIEGNFNDRNYILSIREQSLRRQQIDARSANQRDNVGPQYDFQLRDMAMDYGIDFDNVTAVADDIKENYQRSAERTAGSAVRMDIGKPLDSFASRFADEFFSLDTLERLKIENQIKSAAGAYVGFAKGAYSLVTDTADLVAGGLELTGELAAVHLGLTDTLGDKTETLVSLGENWDKLDLDGMVRMELHKYFTNLAVKDDPFAYGEFGGRIGFEVLTDITPEGAAIAAEKGLASAGRIANYSADLLRVANRAADLAEASHLARATVRALEATASGLQTTGKVFENLSAGIKATREGLGSLRTALNERTKDAFRAFLTSSPTGLYGSELDQVINVRKALAKADNLIDKANAPNLSSEESARLLNQAEGVRQQVVRDLGNANEYVRDAVLQRRPDLPDIEDRVMSSYLQNSVLKKADDLVRRSDAPDLLPEQKAVFRSEAEKVRQEAIDQLARSSRSVRESVLGSNPADTDLADQVNITRIKETLLGRADDNLRRVVAPDISPNEQAILRQEADILRQQGLVELAQANDTVRRAVFQARPQEEEALQSLMRLASPTEPAETRLAGKADTAVERLRALRAGPPRGGGASSVKMPGKEPESLELSGLELPDRPLLADSPGGHGRDAFSSIEARAPPSGPPVLGKAEPLDSKNLRKSIESSPIGEPLPPPKDNPLANIDKPVSPGPKGINPSEGASPRGPPTGQPGSKENPLRGSDVTELAKNLEGYTIQLPSGQNKDLTEPITLGNLVGSPGHFGAVYEIEGQPGRLVKVIHHEEGGSQSVARQVSGYDLIKDDPNIPTARIFDYKAGGTDEPSFIVVEDLNSGVWKDKKVRLHSGTAKLTADERKALKTLYDNLADRGLVWVDGHAGNAFFFEEEGVLKAGILDHDTIFPATEFHKQSNTVFNIAGNAYGGKGKFVMDPLLNAFKGPDVDAKELMDAFYRVRYGITDEGKGLKPLASASAAETLPQTNPGAATAGRRSGSNLRLSQEGPGSGVPATPRRIHAVPPESFAPLPKEPPPLPRLPVEVQPRNFGPDDLKGLAINDRIVPHRSEVLGAQLEGESVVVKIKASKAEYENQRTAFEVVQNMASDNIIIPKPLGRIETSRLPASVQKEIGKIDDDILDVFQNSDTLIQERLPDEFDTTLKDVLERGKAIDPISEGDWKSLQQTLQSINDKGVMHSDLTNLSNILISQTQVEGRVRTKFAIIDWEGPKRTDVVADQVALEDIGKRLGDNGLITRESDLPKSAGRPLDQDLRLSSEGYSPIDTGRPQPRLIGQQRVETGNLYNLFGRDIGQAQKAFRQGQISRDEFIDLVKLDRETKGLFLADEAPPLQADLDPAALEKAREKASERFFHEFGGSSERVLERAGELTPEELYALGGVRRDVREFLAKEAEEADLLINGPAENRYAGPIQTAYWRAHDGFREKTEEGALDVIRRAAADGNPLAKAFLKDRKAGKVKLEFEPELNALGANPRGTRDIIVNPFYRHPELTGGKTSVRTQSDLAATILHEYAHTHGLGELRAHIEEFAILEKYGRSGAAKYDEAKAFTEIFNQDPVSAIQSKRRDLVGRYKNVYDDRTLLYEVADIRLEDREILSHVEADKAFDAMLKKAELTVPDEPLLGKSGFRSASTERMPADPLDSDSLPNRGELRASLAGDDSPTVSLRPEERVSSPIKTGTLDQPRPLIDQPVSVGYGMTRPDLSESERIRRMFIDVEARARAAQATGDRKAFEEAVQNASDLSVATSIYRDMSKVERGRANEVVEILRRLRRENPELRDVDPYHLLSNAMLRSKADESPEVVAATIVSMKRIDVSVEQLSKAANVSRLNAEGALRTAWEREAFMDLKLDAAERMARATDEDALKALGSKRLDSPIGPNRTVGDAAGRLRDVRKQEVDNAVADALEGIDFSAADNLIQAANSVRRQFGSREIPEEALRSGSQRALQRVTARKQNLQARITEIESGLMPGQRVDSARWEELKGLYAAGEKLSRQEEVLDQLVSNPLVHERRVDDLVVYGPDPEVRGFTSGPRPRRAKADRPPATGDIRNPEVMVEAVSDIPYPKAYLASTRKVKGTGTKEGVAERLVLYKKSLDKPNGDGSTLRTRMTQGTVDDPEVQKAVLAFLSEHGDWADMAKDLPSAEPEVAARLMEFRSWVFNKLKKEFGDIQDTGSVGKMSNDLDFSVKGDQPGALLKRIDEYLTNDIVLVEGKKPGLGDWRKKLHMDVFIDSSLIHIYDEIPDDALRKSIALDQELFDLAELVELDGMRHSMSKGAFREFLKSVYPDRTVEGVERQIEKAFRGANDKEQLLQRLDEAVTAFNKAKDPKYAREVSKIQIMVNRITEDAYRTPGAVKQTVSYKEGLVPFAEPLTLKLPSGKLKTFENVRQMRAELEDLKKLPATIENTADQLALLRRVNALEKRLLQVNPVERYQSILSNIHFFEHKVIGLEGPYPALEALRRYESSKYLTRVFQEAFDLSDIDSGPLSFVRETQYRLKQFYKERGPTIEKYFGGEGSELTAAQLEDLNREAEAFIARLRQVNAELAKSARRQAMAAMKGEAHVSGVARRGLEEAKGSIRYSVENLEELKTAAAAGGLMPESLQVRPDLHAGRIVNTPQGRPPLYVQRASDSSGPAVASAAVRAIDPNTTLNERSFIDWSNLTGKGYRSNPRLRGTTPRGLIDMLIPVDGMKAYSAALTYKKMIEERTKGKELLVETTLDTSLPQSDHWMIVEKMTDQNVILGDPWYGVSIRVSKEDFENHWNRASTLVVTKAEK